MSEIERAREGHYEPAIDGTAVRTGLNALKGFSKKVASKIAKLTGKPCVTAANKFMAQGSLDPMVRAPAALRRAAVALMKIANDIHGGVILLLCNKFTLPQPDALLAATALDHGLGVVSRSTADFERAGVRLLNPWLEAA